MNSITVGQNTDFCALINCLNAHFSIFSPTVQQLKDRKSSVFPSVSRHERKMADGERGLGGRGERENKYQGLAQA